MDETLAKEQFGIWNDALQTKDPKTVAALYADDATFLPTLSPDFKSGKDGAESYFEHFCQKDPFGTVVDGAFQALSDTCFLYSGMYDFEVGPADAREVVHARFTLVWEQRGDQWEIIHHHSSLLPE